MFGYILPEKPELKIKEFELFKAYYCGVCKSIGSRHGQIQRMSLNYDSTFLALLLSSMYDEKLEVRRERCIAHQLNKRHIVKNNAIIDYAADMNIILTYYKLDDNWKDEKSVVSAAAKLLLLRSYKKLYRKYPEKCAIIEKKLKELSELEKTKCNSMDKAADPFAKIMEELIINKSFGIDKDNESILRWAGYNIGKWIYILDAFDDLEKDIKKKNYNPLLIQYGYVENEGLGCFKARIKEKVEFNLTYSLGQIAKAYELLKLKMNSGIIENIIYMGMLRKTEQILNAGSCGKVEKSL